MSKDFSHAPTCVLFTCCGSKCKKNGGKQLYKHLKSRVKSLRLKGKVQVIKTGCTDRCKAGPILSVMPANEWYLKVTEEKGIKILEQQVSKL